MVSFDKFLSNQSAPSVIRQILTRNTKHASTSSSGPMVFVFLDPTQDALAIFLLQVFLTLAVTRMMGHVLSFVRQPKVIGEMIGGEWLPGPTTLLRKRVISAPSFLHFMIMLISESHRGWHPFVSWWLAGIVLGPTVLGHIPSFSQYIFPQMSAPYTDGVVLKSLDTFAVTANMGLIFFMFMMGLEIEPEELQKSWKLTIPVASTSLCDVA